MHPREVVSLNPDEIEPWLRGADDIDLATPWADTDFRGVIVSEKDARCSRSGTPRQTRLI
jgi:putative SOS response-associated peptidase YedK